MRRPSPSTLRSIGWAAPSALSIIRRPLVTGTVEVTSTRTSVPRKRGDVAALLDALRREAGVGREVVLERDLVDVGQIGHLDAMEPRAHAAGLDEVLGRLLQVEQHEQLLAGLAVGGHRPALPVAFAAPHRELDRFRVEAGEPRAHLEIRPARDGDGAGQDLDPVWARQRVGLPGHEEEQRAVLQERGRQQDRGDPGQSGSGRERGEPAQQRPVDRGAPVQRLGAHDRPLDQGVDQGVRRSSAARGWRGRGAQLDRRQQLGLELRLVLFDVERDLAVAHAAQERQHQEPDGERRERDPDQRADDGDRHVAVVEAIERPHRHADGGEPGQQEDREPAQQYLETPAPARGADRSQQLVVSVARVGHHLDLLGRRLRRPLPSRRR